MAAQDLSPAPSLPRPFLAETEKGNRLPGSEGSAGRWEAPPESLTHAGGPAGRSRRAAPPPAAAAGGGPCAPLLPLRSSDWAGRCLHLPAALLGLSRLRGPRGRGGGGSRRRASAPPAQAAAFAPWLAPAGGRDLPVLLRRWVHPERPPAWEPGPRPLQACCSRARRLRLSGGDRSEAGKVSGAGPGRRRQIWGESLAPLSLPPRCGAAHHPAPGPVPGAVTSRPGAARPPRPGAASR